MIDFIGDISIAFLFISIIVNKNINLILDKAFFDKKYRILFQAKNTFEEPYRGTYIRYHKFNFFIFFASFFFIIALLCISFLVIFEINPLIQSNYEWCKLVVIMLILLINCKLAYQAINHIKFHYQMKTAKNLASNIIIFPQRA